MTNHRRHDIADPLLQRVCSEYLEMPGLRLSSSQAQRLWGLDEQTCTRLLDFLVEARFLWRSGQGLYARLTEGRIESLRPQMIRAALNDDRVQRHAKARM
jgi:hypothetical protein